MENERLCRIKPDSNWPKKILDIFNKKLAGKIILLIRDKEGDYRFPPEKTIEDFYLWLWKSEAEELSFIDIWEIKRAKTNNIS